MLPCVRTGDRRLAGEGCVLQVHLPLGAGGVRLRAVPVRHVPLEAPSRGGEGG